ncbi:tRNA uridine-5-carboxymethylaminomethyl(34) synthesis GTPase MnmE [Piscinibacter koreensis]|uniref:tRNA modification GTPase MnmE n=1 Tax=Piscinibacter koreensis TaxID=2742824 RepID=A0A7Y6TUV5_9BURK|nr:tRNA uridine-5-carboxymethylaminomethyl(34) synthesis GTPase MnmE [Schlegelella koreensis]NUZ04400.1 tRNA uridine-5-carboxymethylaminomethyl(34) synthesis GTPase MnmE [Schlegelella koreensis]
MLHDEDPIVAIATANGRGAIGIVRLSGDRLEPLIQAICGRTLEPRRATHGPFLDADGSAIDQGLAIHFPAPHSYTGESVLELQAHGGPVVLQLLLARCLAAAADVEPTTGKPRLPRLRIARPGEFTERAFLNDKLDLAQAEAVGDLIDASTEAAARSATRALAGAFSDEVNALRDRLVDLRMLVEATLDFPDEEIDFLERAGALQRLAAARGQLARVLARARQGALLRDGMRVVLAGQPNVGKSSLLNALAGAELAIVTDVPGTTRDKVAETIQIEGVPIHVVDTAGLRESSDTVERIGIARSWEAVEDADAIVFLHDLTRLGHADYAAGDAAIAARLAEGRADAARVLHVFNKADAAPAVETARGLSISAASGEGLAELRQALLERAGWQAAPEGVFIARARHVHALQRTAAHLDAAAQHASAGDRALELLAEELRLAHDALGEITGAFSADDLLGVIFAGFCIGK